VNASLGHFSGRNEALGPGKADDAVAVGFLHT
jgi:hypothetical protein